MLGTNWSQPEGCISKRLFLDLFSVLFAPRLFFSFHNNRRANLRRQAVCQYLLELTKGPKKLAYLCLQAQGYINTYYDLKTFKIPTILFS